MPIKNTKLENRCRNEMASLVCELKKGHKGNHRYKNQIWTQRGYYLGSVKQVLHF